MPLKMNIESIPHNKMRYESCGDYWIDEAGIMQIRVSDLGNWKQEICVAIHELVEQALCLDREIEEPDIMAFDMQFEKEREEGLHSETDEAGDSSESPYRLEHFTATNIERILAQGLNVDWALYEKAIYEL